MAFDFGTAEANHRVEWADSGQTLDPGGIAMAWVYIDSGAEAEGHDETIIWIADNAGDTLNGFQLDIDGDGTDDLVRILHDTDGAQHLAAAKWADFATPVVTGKWLFIAGAIKENTSGWPKAFVGDLDTAAKEATAYKTQVTGGANFVAVNTGLLEIGNRHNAIERNFHGKIARVMLSELDLANAAAVESFIQRYQWATRPQTELAAAGELSFWVELDDVGENQVDYSGTLSAVGTVTGAVQTEHVPTVSPYHFRTQRGSLVQQVTGEVSAVGSINIALPGEVSSVGSVNIKLPSEVSAVGSVNLALRGEVSDVGSIIVGLRGEVVGGADTREQKQHASEDLTVWTTRASPPNLVVTADDRNDPFGNAVADKLTGLGATGVDDIWTGPTDYVANEPVEISFWLWPETNTGGADNLVLNNSWNGAVGGHWTVDVDLLPPRWNFITREHAAVTVLTEFTADSSGRIGTLLYADTGLISGWYTAFMSVPVLATFRLTGSPYIVTIGFGEPAASANTYGASMHIEEQQYALPLSTDTIGQWEDDGGGTTNIHEAIAELWPDTAPDDTDFIRSGLK